MPYNPKYFILEQRSSLYLIDYNLFFDDMPRLSFHGIPTFCLDNRPEFEIKRFMGVYFYQVNKCLTLINNHYR